MSSTPTSVESARTNWGTKVPLRIVDQVPGPSVRGSRVVIKLDRVTRVFKSRYKYGVAAISEISLAVNENAATLVTGASGSGKTTLLSLVGCMIRPTAGRIYVAGNDVSRLPEEMLNDIRRRTFGFVFQHSLLIHGMSAISNVMLPALPRPEVGAELRLKAHQLLERFALGSRARDRVECLSGGEQQRVAIARALINDPKVVIADEPTAHLGSDDTQGVLRLFSELRSEGKTVVVASHDQELLQSGYFDQVISLSDGRLVSGGR